VIRASTSRARTKGAAQRDEAAFEDEVRRRTAEQVEHERAVLSQAEELAGAGSWEFDLRDGTLRWSAGMYRIRGRAPQARPLTLKDATLDVHPDDRVRVTAAVTRAGAADDDLHSSYRIVRPDASIRHVETRARVQCDAAGAPWRIVGVEVDVSERREIETARLQAESELTVAREVADAAIHAARDEAERANRAKSDFLSRMSHELRTPMNAVLGFGQLLARGDLSVRQRESVDQILRGGAHLLALIDEVLDISRIESGMISLALEAVDLTSALRDAVDLIAPIAAQRDVTLRCDLLAASEIHVTADRQRLRQIILNLLSNAVKYNRHGGDVRLSVGLGDTGRVLVAIEDSGPGIDPAKLGRLFEPFDRLDADHGDVQGTGLGLALSRSLAGQMNGSLTVDSELGRGSVFTLALDRSANPIGSDTLRAARQTGRDGELLGARMLLYIEDNPSNFRLVEQLFADQSAVRVIAAEQGRVGLDLARAHQPDLILLDLHLPDIAGAAVLELLQADPATRAIPVLVLSADVTQHDKRRLRSAGARAFLTKPLDLSELLAEINKNLPDPKDIVA
jgi:signal transduction histidine kinase/CheY-like chemotaxis protein